MKECFYDAAVNQFYYAVFDAASALLLSKDIAVKFHSGTFQQFSLHFIKTGLFTIGMQDDLIYCFQKRQKGDYNFLSDLSGEEANETFSRAKTFVAIAQHWVDLMLNVKLYP